MFFISVDGFLFLVIGTLIYNNILELRNFVPCWRISTEKTSETAKCHRDNSEKQPDFDNGPNDERRPLLTENKALP